MPTRIRRIAVNTGGGDAPGLNAVIRAIVHAAAPLGWEVFGIENGYDGLIKHDALVPLTLDRVRDLIGVGGTILGSTNRGNPFRYPMVRAGRSLEKDVSELLLRRLRKHRIDALIAIGGDGSLGIAARLAQKGLRVIGVPKTIDNDLPETVITFGFDTAVSTATEALDKLRTTAASHQRVMVVELMGREAGWIALDSGVAGSADVILIPEIPFRLERVCAAVQERYRGGKNFCIVVAAEGAAPKGGRLRTLQPKRAGSEFARLGGIADFLCREISARTGRESRSLVLGHLQRGGSPTTFDRLLATRFGSAAVRCASKGLFGHMVALKPPEIVPVPLADVVGRQKLVPVDGDIVESARSLGISFGD